MDVMPVLFEADPRWQLPVCPSCWGQAHWIEGEVNLAKGACRHPWHGRPW